MCCNWKFQGGFSCDVPIRSSPRDYWLYKSEDERDVVVSLYDPIFTKEEIQYLKSLGSEWLIEEEFSENDAIDYESVLYFLPHAPLDLTENILSSQRPHLWLANNMISHTDRYTKAKLCENYPNLGKLVHYLQTNAPPEVKKAHDVDGFATFIPKRKRKTETTPLNSRSHHLI